MAVGNSLVQQQQKPSFSVFLTSTAVQRKINEVIGGKDGQRFMTQILSAVTNNPDLQKCDQMSILNCAFLGESLKLSPSPQLGMYYMVPYKDNKNNRTVATFQLGYKGYIQLAIRSGYYKKINVIAIKEGELKYWDPLNEEISCVLIEDVEAREKAKTIGYYAMFEYLNGFRKAIYWPKTQMELHADQYSSAFHLNAVTNSDPDKCRVSYADFCAGEYPKKEAWKYSSFWYKYFDGMAFKTMLRQLISKWGIMSIELQNAFENDMTFKDEAGNSNYVEIPEDEIPEEITPEVEPEASTDAPNTYSPSDQQPEQVKTNDDDTPDFLK